MTEQSTVGWQPSPENWRKACLSALDKRFGWIKRELEQNGGNLSALPEHQQRLWYWREKAVATYNTIGKLRDAERRSKAYRKLWIELS